MAIRDMDIAAEIIGVNPLKAKLSAFAVSSFFVGISGALFFAVYLGAVEVGEAFGIQKIVPRALHDHHRRAGLDLRQFRGAAFMVLLAGAAEERAGGHDGLAHGPRAHLEFVIVGALIMLFLIVEPHGLAQLWRWRRRN
jgi:branched-chain amino acid transport system permease protein